MNSHQMKLKLSWPTNWVTRKITISPWVWSLDCSHPGWTVFHLLGFDLGCINLSVFNPSSDIAALPLFVIFLGIYGLITMPASNAFSRWREYLADEFALQITGKPEAYTSALRVSAIRIWLKSIPNPGWNSCSIPIPHSRKGSGGRKTFHKHTENQ